MTVDSVAYDPELSGYAAVQQNSKFSGCTPRNHRYLQFEIAGLRRPRCWYGRSQHCRGIHSDDGLMRDTRFQVSGFFT
jgi:hypothetical protein